MTEFDRKVLDNFPGKVVRKDLTSLMKKGANVPTYVLEYLLGMYCATNDEEVIQEGIEKINLVLMCLYYKHLLSLHYSKNPARGQKILFSCRIKLKISN